MGSIMAGVLGGALEGGATQAIKQIDFQQESDLQSMRDARLREWREKHDQNTMDRQSAIEDKRYERQVAADEARQKRQNADLDARDARAGADTEARERRENARWDALQRREETRQDAATSRAEAEAQRKSDRDAEQARHNRATELTKLAQQQLNQGLTADYNETMRQIKVLNNPPDKAIKLERKPGGANEKMISPRSDEPAAQDVSTSADSGNTFDPSKLSEREIDDIKDPQERANLRALKGKKSGDKPAAAPSVMQRANPYLNESNYSLDDLNRLSMNNPNDPLLNAALKLRLKQKQEEFRREQEYDANSASIMEQAGYN